MASVIVEDAGLEVAIRFLPLVHRSWACPIYRMEAAVGVGSPGWG
jgi:hypothetical protein